MFAALGLLGGVRKRLHLVFVGILLAVGVGFVVYVSILRHERDSARTELALCQARYAVTLANVRRSNAVVQTLRHETQAQQAAVLSAREQATYAATKSAKAVRSIAATPVSSSCQAAIAWGANEAAELAKGWKHGP